MLRATFLSVLCWMPAVTSFGVPIAKRGVPTQLRMTDKGSVNVKSVKKQIVYDEKTGRFFESNKDEADCIPDEEFCVVDKETGSMIRLTVEEKERIFLDALQVSRTKEKSYCLRKAFTQFSPLSPFHRLTTSTTDKC